MTQPLRDSPARPALGTSGARCPQEEVAPAHGRLCKAGCGSPAPPSPAELPVLPVRARALPPHCPCRDLVRKTPAASAPGKDPRGAPPNKLGSPSGKAEQQLPAETAATTEGPDLQPASSGPRETLRGSRPRQKPGGSPGEGSPPQSHQEQERRGRLAGRGRKLVPFPHPGHGCTCELQLPRFPS